MKRILVLYYTQTGQLGRIVRSVMKPFEARSDIEVTYEVLASRKPYPFPWPIIRFFDQFPECVYLDAPEMEPFKFDPSVDYDLIVLGYQTWYLSPSLPTTGFLKSPEAAQVMRGKPVVTVIGCRNMWLMSQMVVRKIISELGGRLIGNIALIDQGNSAETFVTVVVWLLFGKREIWKGVLSPAGVAENKIEGASHYGEQLLAGLDDGRIARGEAVLDPAEASPVNPSLVVGEKLAIRSFKVWGWIVRLAGRQGSWLRIPLLGAYALFLGIVIVTILPITVLARWLLSYLPPYRKWLERQVELNQNCLAR